jgi:hypothetical protein
MPSIPLRDDYDAAQLRALARRSRDVRQTRRLLALAAVYDGMSREEAAKQSVGNAAPEWSCQARCGGSFWLPVDYFEGARENEE